MSKAEIELNLLNYLGADKVIWLPLGLFGDEDTNGHVDNFCCFAQPAHVLLAWTEDISDPQYIISRQAYDILDEQTDARGRRFKITKVPIPLPMHYSDEDCIGLLPLASLSSSSTTASGDSNLRSTGTRLAASYINFYIANGGVVMPGFNDPVNDEFARNIIQEAFPQRRVIQVMTRDIVLGGGNIHCITQQQCHSQ